MNAVKARIVLEQLTRLQVMHLLSYYGNNLDSESRQFANDDESSQSQDCPAAADKIYRYVTGGHS